MLGTDTVLQLTDVMLHLHEWGFSVGQMGSSARSPNVCFSPADEQSVLCDGVLWDLRGKPA